MKKLYILFLVSIVTICMMSACGSKESSETPANQTSQTVDTQESGGVREYPFEEPIVALDNEYVCIQITGKMDVDPNNRGDWMYTGAVGYSYIIENKLPDASFQVYFADASVDGFMLDMQAGPYSTIQSFDAEKKGKGYFYIPLDGRELGVDIETIDDLHDFDGKVQLTIDDDGDGGYGNDYHGEEVPLMPLLTTLP